MDINRFTEKAQASVRAAQTLATRYSNQQIEVEHLLLALLEQEGGLVPSVLSKAAVNVDTLRQAVEGEIAKFPKVSGPSGPVDQVYITARLNKRGGGRGDYYIKLKIVVPQNPTEKEKELFRQLSEISQFKPRQS